MWAHLVIAVVVAVVVSGFYAGYSQGDIYQIDPVAMGAFSLATIITVLLNSAASGLAAGRSNTSSRAGSPKKKPAKLDKDRHEGTVKWFNVSKGFGFITRDGGDDIFVHYRAIRGQGRRRLFDGQQVTFYIIDSDKGLQADDVEIIK